MLHQQVFRVDYISRSTTIRTPTLVRILGTEPAEGKGGGGGRGVEKCCVNTIWVSFNLG